MTVRILTAMCALCFLWLSSALLGNEAAAQDQEQSSTCLSPNYGTCMDKSGGVTIEMVECLENERKAVQEKIKDLYQQITALQNEGRTAQLAALMDSWKQYRKEKGVFLYDPEGGSQARILSLDWTLDETNRMCVWLSMLRADLP